MASIIVTVVLGIIAIGVTWYLSNKASQDLREIKTLSENMNQLSLKLIDKALDVNRIMAKTNQEAVREFIRNYSKRRLGDKAQNKEVELGIDTAAYVGSALVATGAILPIGAGVKLEKDLMDALHGKLAGNDEADYLGNKEKKDDKGPGIIIADE